MMSSVKKNIKIAIKLIVFLGFTSLFAFILISANVKIGEVVCTQIEVNIDDTNGVEFLRENEILDFINNNGASIVINKKIKDIDKVAIEKRIEENMYVSKAEVYSNFDGKLYVNVTQKKPYYRVFNNESVSYYMDINNERIPISSNFTPRLIVATGYLTNNALPSDTLNRHLLHLIQYINNDAFWEAMVGQIDVKKNGDFVLYTKIAEHSILFGSIADMENKFKRLKIFYKEAIKNVNWKQYNKINLKYKNQIICTKK